MGGLAFGQGYFGQYALDGIVPIIPTAVSEVTILVDAYVSTVIVPAIETNTEVSA